jgi:hypothetical protein
LSERKIHESKVGKIEGRISQKRKIVEIEEAELEVRQQARSPAVLAAAKKTAEQAADAAARKAAARHMLTPTMVAATHLALHLRAEGSERDTWITHETKVSTEDLNKVLRRLNNHDQTKALSASSLGKVISVFNEQEGAGACPDALRFEKARFIADAGTKRKGAAANPRGASRGTSYTLSYRASTKVAPDQLTLPVVLPLSVLGHSGLTVDGTDLEKLRDNKWLSGDLITCYMSLLQQQQTARAPDLPVCSFFQDHFATKALKRRAEIGDLVRWAKKVFESGTGAGPGLKFTYTHVFIPCNINENHWCLFIVDVEAARFWYYDSFGQACPKKLEDRLPKCLREASGGVIQDDWPVCSLIGPVQTNGVDCGVFMLAGILHMTAGLPLSFAQQDMPYLRTRILLDLIGAAAHMSLPPPPHHHHHHTATTTTHTNTHTHTHTHTHAHHTPPPPPSTAGSATDLAVSRD